jgi:ElaB/YqjD/DUF883 family membrane-anchored ribosome-binding protein
MQTKSNIPESGGNGHAVGLTPAVIASADAALSGVSHEFHNFLTDIEDLIKATTSLTGADLARARAQLNARVAAAKESVEQVGGAIADQARKSVKVTDGYVHDNPWQAIGVGAALGLLVGFVLARRA